MIKEIIADEMDSKASTSYVTVVLEDVGWRSVTAETAPFADKMHTALGLCCANANILEAMSCKIRLELHVLPQPISLRIQVVMKTIGTYSI